MEMQWGDGFEIETLINCRVAVANLRVTEVPSTELLRLFGVSNLNAFKDGLRVLKTLTTEWNRARLVKGTTFRSRRLQRRTATTVQTQPAAQMVDREPIMIS